MIKINTYYTAYSVLKNYVDKQGLKIVNFSLIKQSPDRVTMWVEDNDRNITHFVCIKMACTQFLIWGYNSDYEQVIATGFDYADVNTPELEL